MNKSQVPDLYDNYELLSAVWCERKSPYPLFPEDFGGI